MPNWKKIIVSGSSAELNAITMSGNILPDNDNVHSLGASNKRFLLNGGTPVTVTGSGTANTITRFQGATTVEDSKITSTDTQTIIEHDNNGNNILIISGSNGQMLTVSDEVGDNLFTVNNSSGLERFSVSSSGQISMPALSFVDNDFVLSYNSSSGIVSFSSASDAVSSSYADTASIALSGDGVFSGSFSGSFEGDGSSLTSVNAVKTIFVSVTGFEYVIDNQIRPELSLNRSTTYRFDQSDASNSNHPLRFRLPDNTSYTVGVTANGTPGNEGAYTEIEVGYQTSGSLKYYCTVHGNGMGNLLQIVDNYNAVITGSFSGNLSGTSTSASHAEFSDNSRDAVSSSFATTASFALNVEPTDTGSLLTTASADANTITFTKGDSSTFDITVQTGSIPSGTVSSSAQTIANLPAGVVSGSAQTVANLSNQDVDLGTGDLTASDITSTNFTINDTLTAPTITGSLLRLSENGTGLRLTNVGGFEPQSGVFNIFGNNNVTFGAGGSGASERVLTLVESNRHAQFEAAVSASVFSGSFVGDGSGLTGVITSLPNGIVSSSAQTIANLPAGVVSGSVQVGITATTGYASFSSSLETTDQTISSSVAALSGSASDARNNITNVLSSSFAVTASYAISASVEVIKEVSSSYAETASHAEFSDNSRDAVSSSFATTASFALNVEPTDTGSLLTTASAVESTITFTKGDGSQFNIAISQTGSVENAVSASHAEFADESGTSVSSSYADTASIALSGDGIFSGSFSGSFDGSGATLTFGTFGSTNEVLLVGANKTITSSDIFTINVDQRTVSADSFLGSFSGSFIGDGSQLNNVAVFPYTGSAGVSGSIDLNGNANIIGGANFDVFATPQTASGDSIIPDGYYAKMFGPVLVSGTVTVGTGSILKVEPF